MWLENKKAWTETYTVRTYGIETLDIITLLQAIPQSTSTFRQDLVDDNA